MLKITTANGSTYMINLEGKTWQRVAHDPSKADPTHGVRTESGVFITIDRLSIGAGMFMICPPLNSAADFRMLWTSPVTTIEEVTHA